MGTRSWPVAALGAAAAFTIVFGNLTTTAYAQTLTCVEQGQGPVIGAFNPAGSQFTGAVNTLGPGNLKSPEGFPIVRIDNPGDETSDVILRVTSPAGLAQDIVLTGLPAGRSFVVLPQLGANPAGNIIFSNRVFVAGLTEFGNGTATFSGGVETQLATLGQPFFQNGFACDLPMQGPIRAFLQRRMDNLLTYGPDRARLLRRLDGQRSMPGMKDTSLKDGPMVADARTGIDFWVEVSGARFDNDRADLTRDGDFGVLYTGVDQMIAPGVLVGFIAQFDRAEEKFDDGAGNTAKVDGTGWMVGPYAALRLSENFLFDTRFAYGQSDNDIRISEAVFGTRTGSFDTYRWLATASLTGLFHADGFRISPSLGIEYGSDRQKSFVNSFGDKVDANRITLGRMTAGTEVGYEIKSADGSSVEPHVGVKGIWTFDSDAIEINGIETDVDDFRAILEAGVIIRSADGLAVRAAATYDGIGAANYEAWGGNIWINIPLN
jgi:hypothetical protein